MTKPKPALPPRYTPDTEQVREIVARHLTKPAPGAVNDVAYFTTAEGRNAFDRWLRAYSETVWRAGYTIADTGGDPSDSPYLAQS